MEDKKKRAKDLFKSERVKHPRARRTPQYRKIMQCIQGKDELTAEKISELTGINLLSVKRSLRTLTKDGLLEETPEGLSLRKFTEPFELEPIGPIELIKTVEVKRIESSYTRGPGGSVFVNDEKTLKRFLREGYIVTEENKKASPKHWALRRSSDDEKIVWDCDLSSRELTIDDMVEMGYTIIHQGEYPTGTIYKKWWQIRRRPNL